jgi:hypothetical protein
MKFEIVVSTTTNTDVQRQNSEKMSFVEVAWNDVNLNYSAAFTVARS